MQFRLPVEEEVPQVGILILAAGGVERDHFGKCKSDANEASREFKHCEKTAVPGSDP